MSRKNIAIRRFQELDYDTKKGIIGKIDIITLDNIAYFQSIIGRYMTGGLTMISIIR